MKEWDFLCMRHNLTDDNVTGVLLNKSQTMDIFPLKTKFTKATGEAFK